MREGVLVPSLQDRLLHVDGLKLMDETVFQQEDILPPDKEVAL